MRTAYRVLAYAIAVEVAVQAMAVAWAMAGLGTWIMGGGVADASLMQSEATPFPEIAGFMIHAVNGTFVVPVIALALLVLSFFTRRRRPVVFAAVLFVLVVLQGQLGFLGHELPAVGAVHGLNALLLFAVALYTARRVDSSRRVTVQEDQVTTAAP
jgi:heme A synthase